MVVSPLVEAVTASFYAWEIRGRGWAVAPYAVTLEPPFRHCFLLPQYEPSAQTADDGRRPTFLSSFADGIRDAFTNTPAPVPVKQAARAFEEPAPYPAEVETNHVTFRIAVPEDFASDIQATERFLSSLAPLYAPVSLELIGHSGRVVLQVVCGPADAARVSSLLSGYFPGAAITESDDALLGAWQRNREAFIVDFGLADEFFLPLASFRNYGLDPYIPLVGALARAKDNECLVYQVLLTPVVNRWDRAIVSALLPYGKPFFEDSPEILPLAKEKLSTRLFAAVVRVAASARTSERARELGRGTADYITQFARTGSNNLMPLVNEGYPDDEHEAAVLLRGTCRTGMLLSAAELSALVHLPDASVRHPAFERLIKRTKALPAEAKGHLLRLGVNEHQNHEEVATLDLPARLRHMHIVGASGTGKSTLLLNLISQDIREGYGVAVLDPHGDLIDAVLSRIPPERFRDVAIFDPADETAPIGVNLLQARTPVEKTLLSSDLVSVFQRYATSWGDAMSTVLGNAILALLEAEEPTTLLDLRRFLVDERFRRAFLGRITDPEVQFFWQHEFPLIGNRALGPILTRLNTFLRPRLVRNVVAQRRPRLDLEAAVNGEKIFLAKLAQGFIGSENCYLLGSLIATKFHQVAVSRQGLAPEKRPPYIVYMDEFQHFITPSIDSLLTEARKYSMGLVLAHQTLHQLRDMAQVEAAVLGNAHTRIVMRVGDDDARRLAEGLSFFESKDLSNLKQGEAIVRLGQSGNDFNLRVELPEEPRTSVEQTKEQVLALSREQFGTDATALAEELAASYGTITSVPDSASVPDIAPEVEPPHEVQTPPPEPVAEPARPTRKATPKKDESLIEGRGGREHKYLQHLVKRLAEERGFRSTIEQPILEGAGKVDVSLIRESTRIAVEISVSTGHEWEIKNVRQSLSAGYEHVVILIAAGRATQAFEKRVMAELDEAERPHVRVLSAEGIVEYLDQFEAKQPEDSMVRGYKVKVRRRSIVPEDAARRRKDVASVIAKSLDKNKRK